MVINPKEFLDLYFAVMKENEITCINIADISEVIRIIYASSEFRKLKEKLNINNLDVADILNHDFTIKLDENGILDFSVTDEEKDKILIKDIEITNLLQNAIFKRSISGMLALQSRGAIKFKYDESDGTYNLQCTQENPISEGETRIYTDGTIEELPNNDFKTLYSNARDVNVTNSTYTILVDLVQGKPVEVELRGQACGDYLMMAQEALRLLHGIEESYRAFDDIKPKIYRRKIN